MIPETAEHSQVTVAECQQKITKSTGDMAEWCHQSYSTFARRQVTEHFWRQQWSSIIRRRL